jgi:hypothetical protein
VVLAPLAAEQSSQRRATMADDSEDDEPAFDLFDDADAGDAASPEPPESTPPSPRDSVSAGDAEGVNAAAPQLLGAEEIFGVAAGSDRFGGEISEPSLTVDSDDESPAVNAFLPVSAASDSQEDGWIIQDGSYTARYGDLLGTGSEVETSPLVTACMMCRVPLGSLSLKKTNQCCRCNMVFCSDCMFIGNPTNMNPSAPSEWSGYFRSVVRTLPGARPRAQLGLCKKCWKEDYADCLDTNQDWTRLQEVIDQLSLRPLAELQALAASEGVTLEKKAASEVLGRLHLLRTLSWVDHLVREPGNDYRNLFHRHQEDLLNDNLSDWLLCVVRLTDWEREKKWKPLLEWLAPRIGWLDAIVLLWYVPLRFEPGRRAVIQTAVEGLEKAEVDDLCCVLDLLLRIAEDFGAAAEKLRDLLLRKARAHKEVAALLKLAWRQSDDGCRLLRAVNQTRELELRRLDDWVEQVSSEDDRRRDQAKFDYWQTQPFPLPTSPAARCFGVEKWKDRMRSQAAPLKLELRIERDADGTTGTQTALIKRDKHAVVEQRISRILRLMERVVLADPEVIRLLEENRVNPEHLRKGTYSIVCIKEDIALVEAVKGARTLLEIHQRSDGSPVSKESPWRGAQKLHEYLNNKNSGGDLPAVHKRLAASAALSAVYSFLVGIGDRHEENVMVTSEGILFHIDFGFVLGAEPLIAAGIQQAGGLQPMRLDYDELASAIGDQQMDTLFWPLLEKAFHALRNRTPVWAALLENAMPSVPEGQVPKFVREHYLPGMKDADAKLCFRVVVENSCDGKSTWLRDRVLDLKRNVMNSTPSAQWNRQRVFSALACSFGTVRGALEHAAKSIVLPRKCRYCSQDITDRNPVRGDVCAACLRHAGRAATY